MTQKSLDIYLDWEIYHTPNHTPLLSAIRILKGSSAWVFCNRGVSKNSSKFIGKDLCWKDIFSKPTTLLEKWLHRRCFSVNFAQISRATNLWNTCGHLHLDFESNKKSCFSWRTALGPIYFFTDPGPIYVLTTPNSGITISWLPASKITFWKLPLTKK